MTGFIPRADQLYRAVREDKAFTPPALGTALKDRFPEVLEMARVYKSEDVQVAQREQRFVESRFVWADREILDLLSLPILSGDPQSALQDPFSVLLSKQTSERYFGSENALGQVIKVDGQAYHVAGIFADLPGNSHIHINAIAPYETFLKKIGMDPGRWTSNFSYTYLMLDRGTNIQALGEKIHADVEVPLYQQFGLKPPYDRRYFLQSVTEIHLHSHRMQEAEANGDSRTVTLFAAIAGLILLIAAVNYMNLATARSSQRAREVGIRKVAGAQRRQLIGQFLGESLILTLLAMVLGVLIASAALPFFRTLVERDLSLTGSASLPALAALAGLMLLVGLLAGVYPALVLSGFLPKTVLTGSFSRSSQGKALRHALVLFQFSVTILLLFGTMMIRQQLGYIQHADMGYNREQIVTLPVRDGAVRRNIDAIKNELLKQTGVVAVATSDRLPNAIDTFMARPFNASRPDEPIAIFYTTVDENFIDLYQIPVIEGRNFSQAFPSDRDGAFLLNEAAVRAAGWTSPIGETFTHWNGKTGPVVGVIKDFHLRSLHSPIEPLYLYYEPNRFSYVQVRIRPENMPATLDGIQKVMKTFAPDAPFDYTFLDQAFGEAYRSEQRLAAIFTAFSGLAIIVACLGLLGLTAFSAEQRTKEIGIRKVMGATVAQIFLLLSRFFLQWILLSNLLAWPIAYFASQKWLNQFAFHMTLGPATYLISSAIALLIALLTVGYQTLKAAAAKPVVSLKYE